MPKAECKENKSDPWGSAIDYTDEVFIENGRYIVKQVRVVGTKDENAYYVITYTAANLFKNVIEDFRFTRWATGLSCVFTVALAISLAVSYSIVKKSR